METFVRRTIAVAALALALCSVGLASADQEMLAVPAPPAAASSLAWPRQFTQGDIGYTIYPPQLDRWQGDRLEGRAAVAVQFAASDHPTFGVIFLSARTEADGAMVRVRDITASRASFPTATDRAGALLDAVRKDLSGMTWNISADRLRADVAIDRAVQQAQGEPLRNDPPRIVFSQSPAILVPVDGQPVLREMVGLDLMRVLNTRALILLEKSTGRYFLSVAGRWLEAPSIDGPWTDAQVRPSALEDAKQQAEAGSQVDLLEGSDNDNGTLSVIVSTVPAELVQTEGPPQYSPIERTQLLYVANSSNRLFLDLSTQQHYVLLAGRWFRTRSLSQGPWEYVAASALPVDFARIPDSHPTESVRAAVPGTPQAQEAVIANSVPQVATVNRGAAQLTFAYDGPPQFQRIEGTSLESAVNAPMPVIRVDGNSYYALDNGVWFFAQSAEGPWAVATTVPPVIYTIPHSSPLHYVTYVRVYDATGDDVYVGYTPGYVGSYVAPDNTVVYGTGWYYTPWIGTVYYCPPVTWGFGFTYWNTWWNPWPWRPWYARWGPHPHPHFHPAWGPWVAPHALRQAPVARVAAPQVVRPVNVNRMPQTAAAANVTNIYRRWSQNAVVARSTTARPSVVAPPPLARPQVSTPSPAPASPLAVPRAAPLRQNAAPVVVAPLAPHAGARPGAVPLAPKQNSAPAAVPAPPSAPVKAIDPRRAALPGAPLITVPPAASPAMRGLPRQSMPVPGAVAPAAAAVTPRPAGVMDRPMRAAPAIERPTATGPVVAPAPAGSPGTSKPAAAGKSESKAFSSQGQGRGGPVMR